MEPDELHEAWRPTPDPSRRVRVWAGIEQGLDARRARAWWPRPVVYGLVGVAATLALILVWGRDRPWQSIDTAHSEQVAHLDDGSTITVARASRVERCAAPGQCFAVARGAADFRVTAQRAPFRVRAAEVEVRVVGTRFRVARGEDDVVDVAVAEGRVEISRGGVVVRTLGAGESWHSAAVAPPAAEPSVAQVDAVDAGVAVATRDAEVPEPGGARVPDAGATGRVREAAVAEGLSADALWSRAVEAKLQDDLELEELSYRQLVRRFPRDARAGRASFELARLAMDVQKSPVDAVRWLQAALARGPEASYAEDAWARLARAADATGQLQVCREARSTYLSRYPRGVHAGLVREACPD